MSTSQVKFFHSNMTGAPVLSGTVNALIDVLDACLVNGWGTATVDSVVISGSVATVTRAAGHPFEADCVTEISGATVTGGSINGQFKVLSATPTAYTFAAPAGVGNQTATGTISHKVAAAGWTKPFSGTNLAAYRMDSASGLGHYLRVDDTGTQDARVRGFGSMTGIDVGDDPFPTVATAPGSGLFWPKSSTASTAARAWALYADSRGFIFTPHFASPWPTESYAVGFGEFASRKSPDPWATYISGPTSSIATTQPASNSSQLSTVNVNSSYAARGVSGIGSSVLLVRQATTFGTHQGSTKYSGENSDLAHVAYPDPANNSLILSPLMLCESIVSWRGAIPGFWYCPQRVGSSPFTQRAVVSGVDALPGRRLRAFVALGPAFIDVTGPWR